MYDHLYMLAMAFLSFSTMSQYIRTKFRTSVILGSCFIVLYSYAHMLLCLVLNELKNFGKNEIAPRHGIAFVNISTSSDDCHKCI